MARETETYVGPDQYVKKIGERADGSNIYQAGERSKAYKTGQIVKNSYAQQVLGSVNFRNKVKGMISNLEDKDPDRLSEKEREVLEGGYNEAQKVQSEFAQLGKNLNKAQEENNEPKIEELEQKIDNLRSDLGS